MPGMTRSLLAVAVLTLAGCDVYDEPVRVTLHKPGDYKGGEVVVLDAEQEEAIAKRFENQGDR